MIFIADIVWNYKCICKNQLWWLFYLEFEERLKCLFDIIIWNDKKVNLVTKTINFGLHTCLHNSKYKNSGLSIGTGTS